jgi:hypothetical protein
VAQRDSELISLGGPDQRVTVDTVVAGAPQALDVLDEDSRGWLFHCPSPDRWVFHPGSNQVPITASAESACGATSKPDIARLVFRTDAWGRLNGRESAPPFDARHNARWQRMAVNLVGTGIRDCSLAADPDRCYSESFVRYDFRHVGPAWVTNFEQQWRALGQVGAQIESGKAIAAEEWLDPLINGWSKPLVHEAARDELVERALGGVYQLDLELTPDVRLDRIERVQILTETSYWVSQN